MEEERVENELPGMFEYVIRGDLQLLEHWRRICDRNRENFKAVS